MEAFPTTDSFMYQTMHRQPDDVRRLVTDGWDDAREAADIIRRAERIWVTGIGTSFHAALVGGWLLRATGRDARAVLSFATPPAVTTRAAPGLSAAASSVRAEMPAPLPQLARRVSNWRSRASARPPAR